MRGGGIKKNNPYSRTVGIDYETGDQPIILGNQITNPYTVSNMQFTANILFGSAAPTLLANHKYIRYKPNTYAQVDILADNEDLDVQDYPMDYEILQDGEYYQAPNEDAEDFPWFYAFVANNYVPISGISYEVIADLYLPNNTSSFFEDLAESIAAGGTYITNVDRNGNAQITRTDVQPNISCLRPIWCTTLNTGGVFLEPDECPPPGGSGVVPPTLPSDRGIYVTEQTMCNAPTRVVPLRQARVICRRWFKRWQGYTSDIGTFLCDAFFKNNVNVFIKTRNAGVSVKKLRGARLWQMYFPMKVKLGLYNGTAAINGLRYVFQKPTDASASSKELALWVGTTTHNSVVEFRQYTNEFNAQNPNDPPLPQLPQHLRVLINNWGNMRDNASAPMFNKCPLPVLQNVEVVQIFSGLFPTSPLVNTAIQIGEIVKSNLDIAVGYASSDYNCILTSTELKSTIYHELGHAQHYTQVGCFYWNNFVSTVITESQNTTAEAKPYGNGTTINSPLIAVCEMWGNFVGYMYLNRHYGNGAPIPFANFRIIGQAGTFVGNNATAGLNAPLWALERFNPNSLNDVHKWIPEGLPYDLMDDRNDLTTNNNDIIDNVNNYTINHCFGVLQNSISSMTEFRNAIINLNVTSTFGTNQTANIDSLFQSYNY